MATESRESRESTESATAATAVPGVPQVLGVDIGGSGIKGALVDTEQGILATERHRIPTPQPATPDAVVATVADLTRFFAWQGPIGCGFPAAIKQGVVCTASHIDTAWLGCVVARQFGSVLRNPIWLMNDADAAGAAEMQFGAGRNQRGLVLVLTVGTGIGSALFIDGHLVPNTELGHIQMQGQEAEAYASDSVRKKKLLEWDEWGRRFNEYLHTMEQLFWPDLIIIGGGASKKFDKFATTLTLRTPVVPARLRNEAGIIGAALTARVRLTGTDKPEIRT